jgi:hypothetical protein
MRRKLQLVISSAMLALLCLSTALTGLAHAQLPTSLSSLTIAVWPEFDQPSVLVIYRGTVPEDVPLPAPLSFELPSSIEAVHAVAYMDQGQGNLVNIPQYDFSASADGKVLSFSTPARSFQFEYYSGDMLSLNDKTRNISFSFTPSADIDTLAFELQQPVGTEDFSSQPSPSSTQVRQDGLTYDLYDLGSASANETYSLTASYTRTNDQLSAETLQSANAPTPVEQKPVEMGGGGLTENLGPILIGFGMVLLFGALGYWYLSQRAVVVPEPAGRRPTRRAQRPARRRPANIRSPRPSGGGQDLAAYCHRCGAEFREDARFCHMCGAERRAE